jgi:deoxycytidine triphosphate deaminase
MPRTDFTAFVDGLVHEPTQTEGRGLDLTVAGVAEVTGPGRVDFGGGELAPAETEPHPSATRDPDDDYEWWTLEEGQYLLEYNERATLPADLALRIQTRDELLTRGACHPSLSVRELAAVPLSVGGAGLKLKENARVLTVVGVERV